jgi:hypothetical protein
MDKTPYDMVTPKAAEKEWIVLGHKKSRFRFAVIAIVGVLVCLVVSCFCLLTNPTWRHAQKTMNSEMKTINYRGGLVRFQIPLNWRDEYDPGTLRLNVISAQSDGGKSPEQTIRSMFVGSSTEQCPSGPLMRLKKLAGEERGTPLLHYRWEIGVPVPPNRIRIICFTYTILARQESDPSIKAELALVDHAIRAAEFSHEPGVSGER